MGVQKQRGKQAEMLEITQQIDKKHREDLQRLKNFRLFDDDFLTKCFEGYTAGIELVLQIVLENPDLKVVDVRTQVFVENLLNRSVRFDILATDSTGAKLNVEIQRFQRICTMEYWQTECGFLKRVGREWKSCAVQWKI